MSNGSNLTDAERQKTASFSSRQPPRSTACVCFTRLSVLGVIEPFLAQDTHIPGGRSEPFLTQMCTMLYVRRRCSECKAYAPRGCRRYPVPGTSFRRMQVNYLPAGAWKAFARSAAPTDTHSCTMHRMGHRVTVGGSLPTSASFRSSVSAHAS